MTRIGLIAACHVATGPGCAPLHPGCAANGLCQQLRLSAIFARSQIRAKYRESTGTREFHFSVWRGGSSPGLTPAKAGGNPGSAINVTRRLRTQCDASHFASTGIAVRPQEPIWATKIVARIERGDMLDRRSRISPAAQSGLRATAFTPRQSTSSRRGARRRAATGRRWCRSGSGRPRSGRCPGRRPRDWRPRGSGRSCRPPSCRRRCP